MIAQGGKHLIQHRYTTKANNEILIVPLAHSISDDKACIQQLPNHPRLEFSHIFEAKFDHPVIVTLIH